MNYKKFIFSIVFIQIFSFFLFAQTKTDSAKSVSPEVKSSSAFAELLLRKTELESELEELLVSYTEEFPKVSETRYEIGVLQREIDKLSKIKPAESGKLTLALGKLMVRKAEIETDHWNFKNRFSDDHPQTKRAKRKLEIFDKAINEIMQ